MKRKIAVPFLALFLVMTTPGVSNTQEKRQVSDAQIHLERARNLETQGSPRAEREYRLAIEARGGEYPEALRDLSFYLERHLRFDEAAGVLKMYVDQTPNEAHVDDLKELEDMRRASVLQVRIRASKRPSLQDLNDFAALVGRYAEDQFTEALPYAERAVELYPTSVEARLALARLLIGPEQDERRCQTLKQVIKLGGDSASTYYELAKCQLILGDVAGAANSFQKTLDLDNGSFANAFEGLGVALSQLGRNEEAVVAFRKYIERGNIPQDQRQQIEQRIGRLIEKLERKK